MISTSGTNREKFEQRAGEESRGVLLRWRIEIAVGKPGRFSVGSSLDHIVTQKKREKKLLRWYCVLIVLSCMIIAF